jgi:ribonuclease D
MADFHDTLITSPAGLDDLVDHIRRARRFALDTEFVSEDTFEPVLGLIQVATSDRVAAVDPLAVRELGAFWDVVTDPEIELVMHAAGEDLRICRLQAGRLPARVVDVQVAAGLVGFGYPVSLGNLLHHTLRVTVFSGETRTDWRRRPLSGAQLRYALDDVRHLLDEADLLNGRLRDMGRLEWAEEEYRGLLASVEARDEADRWRRLPSLHQLSRRGLETARRLWDWRMGEARRSNRPARQVMRDDLLVAVAKRQPAGRKDLEALRDFNRPHLLARANEILGVIAEAKEVPDAQLPEHGERFEEGPGLGMVVSLLAATLNQSCAQAKVATGLVGSNSDLKALVRWHLAGRPPEQAPDLARGWRGEVCGAVLLDVLSGRRALRIVDPESDIPVRLDPIGPGDPPADDAP